MKHSTRSRYYQAGKDAGKAAGSWVIDGNTSAERCQQIIDGYEAGDPEVMDLPPAPLSGEWAGESIPELFGHWPSDRCLELYEEGYSDGFWEEVLRAARYQVEPTA